MTDVVTPGVSAPAATKKVRRDIGIKRRYASERRFRTYGVAAISFGFSGPSSARATRPSSRR